jgi:hypothetical protein
MCTRFQVFTAAIRLYLSSGRTRKTIARIVNDAGITGIISDNVPGAFNTMIPSVYITHQLNPPAGILSWLTRLVHQRIINKFTAFWIADDKELKLSGRLSKKPRGLRRVHYTGLLSRLEPVASEQTYDVLVLLSGPEPQRTELETELLAKLKNFKGKVALVRGTAEADPIKAEPIEVFEILLTQELEQLMASSKVVIARSGYSTIMDLAAMGKQAFFIPTPGQGEQEYLAKYLEERRIAPYSLQKDFQETQLDHISAYTGFPVTETGPRSDLFELFEGE